MKVPFLCLAQKQRMCTFVLRSNRYAHDYILIAYKNNGSPIYFIARFVCSNFPNNRITYARLLENAF